MTASFIEAPQLGVVAKKQGFPKQCPKLANSQKIACDSEPTMKLVEMLVHICTCSHCQD